MLQTIHVNTASTANRSTLTVALKERKNIIKAPKLELSVELANDLAPKLNELAKRRPFNVLHRVKKYDPL